ncbi:hypothetical protein L218DRAFT_551652 [Marasmius fiardii PR-910]|nr:hypothetical protein L218DRAFT_551652 [Marasmius fiardii PR-910]
MSGQQAFSNARGMSFGSASFSNIGHDQVNNDYSFRGALSNNYGYGTQHNYNGSGQFINHGRDQNVNTGRGCFIVNSDRVQNPYSHSQNSARMPGESPTVDCRDEGWRITEIFRSFIAVARSVPMSLFFSVFCLFCVQNYKQER